jgi:hypothetical protein
MARELVILDQQPNNTLRVAFLLPVPSVTALTRTADNQSASVVVTNAGIIPPLPAGIVVPNPLPCVTYNSSGSPLRPTSPSELDPVCAKILSNLELAAYAAGMLAINIYIVQLNPALDTPATFASHTAPAYLELMTAYTQQKADFQAAYTKRSQYVGARLDAI